MAKLAIDSASLDAGNPPDGATACSMRETRETALLHACKVQLHQLIVCIFIYSTKWPYVKTMNGKNTKKSPIHENADANITCDFGDGDISRSRSRFTHTRTGGQANR